MKLYLTISFPIINNSWLICLNCSPRNSIINKIFNSFSISKNKSWEAWILLSSNWMNWWIVLLINQSIKSKNKSQRKCTLEYLSKSRWWVSKKLKPKSTVDISSKCFQSLIRSSKNSWLLLIAMKHSIDFGETTLNLS